MSQTEYEESQPHILLPQLHMMPAVRHRWVGSRPTVFSMKLPCLGRRWCCRDFGIWRGEPRQDDVTAHPGVVANAGGLPSYRRLIFLRHHCITEAVTLDLIPTQCSCELFTDTLYSALAQPSGRSHGRCCTEQLSREDGEEPLGRRSGAV